MNLLMLTQITGMLQPMSQPDRPRRRRMPGNSMRMNNIFRQRPNMDPLMMQLNVLLSTLLKMQNAPSEQIDSYIPITEREDSNPLSTPVKPSFANQVNWRREKFEQDPGTDESESPLAIRQPVTQNTDSVSFTPEQRRQLDAAYQRLLQRNPNMDPARVEMDAEYFEEQQRILANSTNTSVEPGLIGPSAEAINPTSTNASLSPTNSTTAIDEALMKQATQLAYQRFAQRHQGANLALIGPDEELYADIEQTYKELLNARQNIQPSRR